MRRLAATAVICAITMQHASAAMVGPTPVANDRPGWIGFCTGFYREIARQATLDNNALLFNKAQQSIASYGDEALVLASKKVLSGDPAPWLKRGADAAGGEYWDDAPLMDVPGEPPMRTDLIAVRSRYASACDQMATQSQQFRGEAEKLRRSFESPPPPDRKKR